MRHILLDENKEMYEKGAFSDRIAQQMQLPIELAGADIENPRGVMSPALLGGISLACRVL